MLRRAIALPLALVALLIAALALAMRRSSDNRIHDLPVLESPETVDLGEQEIGATAVGQFVVRNAGTAELVLSEFRTSCSCAGVERLVNGNVHPVESVVVAPGDQIHLLSCNGSA